ncbi:FMN-dependent NADH-azoreductase [Leptothrix discophora]|uniref:FMN dependent NADH:quinone oxidoreductase n=1 Tax=Leptothrix discophora TaxID=89 RepID=A0ABT9FYS8_LEPDI|nr:NAD(P)H-dependent oxidoreductase [Leptothrix discophora]MDP4299379.1 NAD(P)H-dependent oxidoreductase [Leptothrix discophora]
MNILQVNTSARTATADAGSLSSRLAAEVVERVLAAHPGASLTVRDLARQPHPVLDEAALQALFTPAEQRSPEAAARVAQDDALIAEIQAADVVVIGSPMFNFGVTAQLKNWIDAIAKVRVTFQYTATGPEGLLKGKKVYVVATRGGIHRELPSDTQVPYLRQVLGFLGMTDVEVIYAEAQGMGPEASERGIAEARAQIDALFGEPATA